MGGGGGGSRRCVGLGSELLEHATSARLLGRSGFIIGWLVASGLGFLLSLVGVGFILGSFGLSLGFTLYISSLLVSITLGFFSGLSSFVFGFLLVGIRLLLGELGLSLLLGGVVLLLFLIFLLRLFLARSFLLLSLGFEVLLGLFTLGSNLLLGFFALLLGLSRLRLFLLSLGCCVGSSLCLCGDGLNAILSVGSSCFSFQLLRLRLCLRCGLLCSGLFLSSG